MSCGLCIGVLHRMIHAWQVPGGTMALVIQAPAEYGRLIQVQLMGMQLFTRKTHSVKLTASGHC